MGNCVFPTFDIWSHRLTYITPFYFTLGFVQFALVIVYCRLLPSPTPVLSVFFKMRL
jgi:hypothetical protein